MSNISYDKLRNCLLDLTVPISQRTHAAFLLRTKGDDESVNILSTAIQNREDSSLMRHELGYILGQIGNPSVLPILTKILSEETEDLLVRHECAEALGAIGSPDSLEVLEKFATHEAPEIAETCQIAIDLIKWRIENNKKSPDYNGGYLSVDPAPSFDKSEDSKDVEKLKATLLDTNLSLFIRYRAMFSLRNLNSDAAALALVEGFKDSSALFRHEVAYVLGQMQRECTIPGNFLFNFPSSLCSIFYHFFIYLILLFYLFFIHPLGLTVVLENSTEHRMVRHEAAEALGAIGGMEVENILEKYLDDKEHVVMESAHVALDTIEYWGNGTENFDEKNDKIVA